MPDYDNTNRGVLFKNQNKKTDSHPDYTGSINIQGTDHWFSAWIKEGKSGKFMSCSIGDVKQPKQPQQPPADDFDDSDIPF